MTNALHVYEGEQSPKVYSYARWSTPEQAQGDTYRRQSDAARKWAERNGLELDDRLAIRDEGKSAYRGDNAKEGGLGKFIEACEQGLIERGSYLIVENLDRLSRMEPVEAQFLFLRILRFDVAIHTLSDGQTYEREAANTNPTGLILSLMVAFRAHEESRTKGRRVAEAWEEKRRQVRQDPTKRLTRRAPSWLIANPNGGWDLDASKVESIRRIFRMALKGIGEHKTASLFNEEGVPVLGRGKHWHRSTVSKVLRNPAVIGQLVAGHIEYHEGKRVHVKETPIDGAFPAIIAQADWLAVRALKDVKTRNARGRHASKAPAHYFAGLASCPKCGASMSRVNKGSAAKGGKPKLVCSAARSKAGCVYKGVCVEAVEAAFVDHWQHLMSSVPADDATGKLTAERDNLEASMAGTEDHLDTHREAYIRNPSTSGARIIGRIEAELRTMQGQLGELQERCEMADRGLIASRLSGVHELMSDPETAVDRSAVNTSLKILFERVVVDYEEGVLRFVWRQGGETVFLYTWVDGPKKPLGRTII